MVEEQKRASIIYAAMSLLLGIILSLLLNSFLGTTIVSDKIDVQNSEVNSLFCTFQRVEFGAEEVMSIATGEKATVINITAGTDFYNFYTYNISQTEFIDVGLIELTKWKDKQLLAFSSERLDDGMSYVIDFGRIVYLNSWGNSSSRTPIIRIEKIHQVNWFDEFSSRNRIGILAFMSFALVLILTLFCLPFIHYYFEYIEEKERKKQPTISQLT